VLIAAVTVIIIVVMLTDMLQSLSRVFSRVFSVIPSGYVGAAFVGGLFVALSGNRIGATFVAGSITFALLLSLW
jgi:hypothetical protein